jgi:hypothetical protein
MKTILKIVIILLVAAVVAGGFYLVVNNTSNSDSAEAGGQRPVMTSTHGTRPERPEGMPERDGDEHGASIGQGLASVGGSLVKLSVIVSLVLLIEKGIALISAKRLPRVRA